MPGSFNYQLTLQLQDELRKRLGEGLYSRITYIWVNTVGETFISLDRIAGPLNDNEGLSLSFRPHTGIAEIAAKVLTLIGC